jgi:hypothetical protein
LSRQSPPSIAGGHFLNDATLGQTYLSVKVAPYNSRGTLIVSVTLAEPPSDNALRDRVAMIRTWFTFDYNDLDRFQSGLVKLLAGETHEALLSGSES